MSRLSINLNIGDDGVLSGSGNFRVYSTVEPVQDVVSVLSLTDDILDNGNPAANIKKYFRYSTDGAGWSMWYAFNVFNEGEPSVVSTIPLAGMGELYFSFKYMYDDGTSDMLTTPVVIASVTMLLSVAQKQAPIKLSAINAQVRCTSEVCPKVVIDRKPSFNMYDTGNMFDMYRSMSMSVNEMAGVQVLYFQSSPDPSGTDYVFREYTLFNIMQRKCMKVVLNNNEMPQTDFRYTGQDMDYVGPIEVHVDRGYFEMMFGTGKEPRKKDIVYLPMLNRLYEVMDVSMSHGFMMMPTFWKLNLVKFRPNINYIPGAETKFLDNIVLTSDGQIGKEAKVQELSALMQQQYSTVSAVSDEARGFVDPGVTFGEVALNFNYTRFINYFYNLSGAALLGVVYKDALTVSQGNDITVAFNFKLNVSSNGVIPLFVTDGTDNLFYISLDYSSRYRTGTLTVSCNGTQYTLDLTDMMHSVWYPVIVSVSPTYGQVGIHVYFLVGDVVDINNVSSISTFASTVVDVVDKSTITFNSKSKLALPKSNTCVSNVRVFNKVVDVDSHEFVVSQLFHRDESSLRVIDNCRPMVGTPFVMKKY